MKTTSISLLIIVLAILASTLLGGFVGFISSICLFGIVAITTYPYYIQIYKYEKQKSQVNYGKQARLAEQMLREGKIRDVNHYFDVIQGKND